MAAVKGGGTAAGKRWWRLPLLAGVLVGVSYLPGPFLPLNLAGFAPLLLWLETRRSATTYERLKAGFVFGLATHLVALHFMYSMLAHSWLAVLLYVGFAAALAVRISLSVALIGWLRRRTGLSWALLLPLGWLPLEWAQTWGDLRMTGEHLAHTVAGYPFLVQFADLLGPYGVGAFLLVVNGLVFEAVRFLGRPAGRRAAVAVTLVVVAVLAYDGWAWTRPATDARTLRVALVQPDVPLAVKHDPGSAGRQWRTLVDLTRRAAERDPDLIVWPESARPHPLIHELDRPESLRMVEVQALARQVGVPLLVGVEYARVRQGEGYRVLNAVFGVDADGRLLEDWAAKVYLVPFVEATPFRSLLGPLVEGRGGEWQWLAGGFEPGPRNVVIDVAGARIGVLVCYEQLFADLARGLRNAGAELQVIVTNDAWFGRSLFQPYQANAVRLRAIENRTAFVRVANTGISGFVDPRGRYHERTGLFEQAVEVWDVPLTTRRTVYARVGDVVAWLAIAALLAAVLVAWIAPRRSERGEPC
jgi:apolipoprotein N-acyltransferase